MRRRGVATLLRLFVSAGIITYLLMTTISMEKVLNSIQGSLLFLQLLAFTLSFVGFTLTSFRWRFLLSAVVKPVSVWLLMRSYLIGMFCNLFLPSTIGGDVYRSMDVSAMTGLPKEQSLAIVVVERFIGALALFTYALVALILGFGHLVDKPGVVTSITTLALAFLGVFLLLTPWSRGLLRRALNIGLLKKLLPRLESAFSAVKALRERKRILTGAFAISLVFQLNVVVFYILVGRALHLPLPIEAYFLVMPIILIILQIPISLNGIGLREAVFILFLGIWGVSEDQAVAFGLVVFAMIFIQGGILGGLFYSFRRSDRTTMGK